jgi:hypothetical protein
VREFEKALPDGELGARLRMIREELYGADGIADLAAALGIAIQSWRNYEEIGELAPAQTLLHFIELTGVDPLWLLSGQGDRFRLGYSPGRPRSDFDDDDSTTARGD